MSVTMTTTIAIPTIEKEQTSELCTGNDVIVMLELLTPTDNNVKNEWFPVICEAHEVGPEGDSLRTS